MTIYIITGSAATVLALGAWTRWGIRPCLAAYRLGVIIGRMQGRR